MIRTPSGKNLMNEQEAIQWLLDNNALPFQCTADYVGGAEIGLGTIVNPTPAKVRVGSLIFFADSKVSTVIAITSNSFICSDEYNDLVDDIVYVSNVQLNGSGHLIVTLSNGTNIDAGLVKQISSFSINASQHLIATYNNGTTTDLGAIFSGNITISGNLTATGTISSPEIVESMSGYSIQMGTVTNLTINPIYAGVVKNGNKLTFVFACNLTKTGTITEQAKLCYLTVPNAVFNKLVPTQIGGFYYLDNKVVHAWDAYNSYKEQKSFIEKTSIRLALTDNDVNTLELNTVYYYRYEVTFLLTDSLI